MVAAVAMLTSCKPEVPSKYIQPDDMEDLIYDYHVAQGIASQEGSNPEYQKRLAFELVLKEHGVTTTEQGGREIWRSREQCSSDVG